MKTSVVLAFIVGLIFGWLFTNEITRILVIRLDDGKKIEETEVDQHGSKVGQTQQERNMQFAK